MGGNSVIFTVGVIKCSTTSRLASFETLGVVDQSVLFGLLLLEVN